MRTASTRCWSGPTGTACRSSGAGAGGNTEQLVGHLNRALANGLSETELVEAITHLAFYAGWPKAMSAIPVARRVFAERHAAASGAGADQAD
ncbi:MAG: carboxymuconolactone decarboxylase family protein [Propionibacteriaceae bacterium]|nr:carboxymuconolactone decarboxylase family protein [Propionibacteriaceae bacterium]